MNNSNSQTAYGVFKPVGHVLASFPNERDARSAIADLKQAGFADDAVAYYPPEDVLERADRDIKNSGVLANIGQELNLVKQQRALAEEGHPFISVRAPQDDDARKAGEICGRHNADRAQRFGSLIVEELIQPGSSHRQVPESPDSGLDAQTRSGHEAGTGPVSH